VIRNGTCCFLENTTDRIKEYHKRGVNIVLEGKSPYSATGAAEFIIFDTENRISVMTTTAPKEGAYTTQSCVIWLARGPWDISERPVPIEYFMSLDETKLEEYKFKMNDGDHIQRTIENRMRSRYFNTGKLD